MAYGRKIGRSALAGVSIAAMMLPVAGIHRASAQNATIVFDVPAGSLGSVLNAIAATGGRSISFPAEFTAGRQAGPITGRKSIRAALGEALAGSDLVVKEGEGGFTIVPIAAARTPVGVNANTATDIADIDVVGSRTGDVGFVAGATASSTRVEATIQDTPQSIVGITKDALTTQATTSVYDAARNVSSVSVAPSTGTGVTPDYNVRGLYSSRILIQGQATGSTNIPIQDIERVDVIKGPSTFLSGVAQLGGAINFITKQPTATQIREVTATVGSYGYKTLGIDLGGIVPQTEGVTYRLNMSGNIADRNYAGYRHPGEYLFSPAVRWEDAFTQVETGIRVVGTRIAPSAYTTFTNLAYGSYPYRIARNQPIGSADAHASNVTFEPYLSFQRVLGNVDMGRFGQLEVDLHSRNQYTQNHYAGNLFAPVAAFSNFVILAGLNQQNRADTVTSQQDITLKQKTEYVTQTMRFGVDYTFTATSTTASTQNASPTFFSSVYTIPTNLPLTRQPIGVSPNGFRSDDIGLSFQDNIDIVDRLHIVGAVRHDEYGSQTDSHSFIYGNRNDSLQRTNQEALSYTAGLAFDVLPWMTIYGTNSDGFQPQTIVLASGGISPPLFNSNTEVGAKTYFLDKRLTVTGALYQNAFSSSIVTTAAGPAIGPAFKSRGIEADVQGQITPGLQAIASFSYARYETGTSPSADRVTGQPALTASAFLNYTVQNGPLQGVSLGAGGHGNGVSYLAGATRTTIPLPGYALADLYAGFHRDTYDINFKLSNVFNKYYFYPASTPLFVPVGEGRAFTLVVKHQF